MQYNADTVQVSLCEKKCCGNPDATHWLQCDSCQGWIHLACAGVRAKVARQKTFKYKCPSC